MKKVILIILVIALVKAMKSQDLVVFNDSSYASTVITEISNNTIKYRRFNMSNGPLYEVDKKTVAYVVFKNGSVERMKNTFNTPQTNPINIESFNLDGSLPQYIKETRIVNKNKEHLYNRKNYIGFNHLALLNSNVSFTYMRDFSKEKLILNIPVAIGIGKPDLTNSVYGGSYLYGGSTNTYNLMKYQFGAGLLFSPSFNNSVNFLIGPSFSVSQYDVSTKTTYVLPSTSQLNTPVKAEFKNDFKVVRQMYGGSIGLLFRISAKLNMSLMANLGCKKDSYNEKDPFGIDFVNSQTTYKKTANANVLPYANFNWTIGYRF